MKKASKLLNRAWIAVIFPLLALGSCITEKEIYPHSGDGDAEITFSLMLPGKSAPATRGMEEEDENRVDYIDILVFKQVSDGGTYEYTTRCSGSAIKTADGSNYRKKSFTVKLRQGSFDLVLLANAPDLTGLSFTGKNKADALKLIEAVMPEDGKWPADGSRPIPMWGEATVTINEDTELTEDDAVLMARMVARVDVQITASNFQLSSVHVYNYNTKGSIAPAAGQWDATTDAAKPKTTAPNVPTSSVLTKGPLEYSGSSVVTDNGCASEIYIFEAENHTGTGHTTAKGLLDRTCLVIGGVYDSDGDSDFTDEGDPTYYRVDFSKGSGVSQEFLDILRNHQYIFSITKVSGAGYETPKIAFESGPVNIEANVLEWNDAEFSEIKFDGQYMLGVSPSSAYEFFKTGEPQSVNITTTHPDGWKILKITEADGVTPPVGDWLRTDRTTGTLYGNSSFKIIVNDNTSGYERTGYIYIKAGKLETKLTVKQFTTVPSMLVITDSYDNAIDALEFAAASGVDPGEQIYKVKWSPKTETLYPSVSAVAYPASDNYYDALEWFHYKTVSGAINDPAGTSVYTSAIDSKTGEVTFTINPKPIASDDSKLMDDPFYERQTMVSFRATGSEGTMRKSIILQQYVYNLIYKAESFYLADGNSYTFNVKSNRPWRAYLIDNGGGMVTSPAENASVPFATGGYNLPSGTDVSFTTIDDLSNPTIFSGTAQVRIVWDNGTGTDAEKTVDLFCASGIIQPKSNSYIVTPNATPILIPVSRANESTILGTQITGAYTAELVWSDVRGTNNTGYDAVNGDTPVKLIQVAGSNADGYILVMPGSKPGNAVVAAKVGADIVWSWHIWVIDSSIPITTTSVAGATWMDRNLGASNKNETVTTANAGAFGLLYQWGRKDPFPGGSSATTADASTTIYNTTTTAAVTFSNTSGLQNSVRNPLLFIHSNWSGSNGDNSWNSSGKTIYDPCPEGYKVPANGLWGTGGSGTGTLGNWAALTNYGRIYTNSGTQYYPAAGYRVYNTGTMAFAGQRGEYWSATALSTNAHSLAFTSSGVYPSNNYNRSYGYSVRCVAE